MSSFPEEIERLRQENDELRREKEEAKAREEEAKAREEEAKAREEEAKAREEEAKAREEEAKAREEEAKAREEEAKAREDAERRKNQRTTLKEYLYNCHFHLYKKLALTDKTRLSTGFTKVEGKYYPKRLRPWTSSMNAQRQLHLEALRRVCGERRLFHQESTTRDLGATIHRRRAGNENAVDHFEKLAVEDPVWEILRPIWTQEELCEEYRCMGLQFSNNMQDFAQQRTDNLVEDENLGEERAERRGRQTGPNKRVASEQRVRRPPTKPDGAGVRTHLSGEESIAFVYDYKAAHKVAVEFLKPAIAKETLFTEVMARVNGDKALNDAVPRGQGWAEDLIAMALTQVFDYMVRHEVAYGYVAAGESLLLLHINRAELQTLYCYPCVPDEDVGRASGGDWTDDKVFFTAVAQLAGFCLLSLGSEALQGASLDEALQRADTSLRKWGEVYDDPMHLLEAEDTDSPPPSSSQTTEGSEFKSSAAPAERKVPLRARPSCRSVTVARSDGTDEEDDGPGADTSRSWARTEVSKRKEGPSSGSSEEGDGGEGGDRNEDTTSPWAPAKRYCTQACLLGLKRGLDLDSNCPNVLSHRPAKGGTQQHPIDADEFSRLVGERLRKNPYRDCEALNGWGKVGSTGVLFRLELAPYGYAFVGKGTLFPHPHYLEHEGRIYAHLDRVQGEVVPVHLGLAQLDRGYVLPGGARVFHMMLMSWGGEDLATAAAAAAAAGDDAMDLAAEVQRSSQAVWAEGVNHGDERDANRLWNEERRRVVLIDFDRAALRPALKHKQLAKVSGKRRKRRGDDFGSCQRKRGFLRGHLQSA